MGRRNDPQIIGYRYLFGIHMGICRGPINELLQIKVGGKNAWFGSAKDNAVINIIQPDLFGGEDGEGGIKGFLNVFMGGPTQVMPVDLSTVLKTPMPGFRRRLTCFFDGMVTAINPYPKKWEFRVRRTTAGWDGDPWYPEKATISIVRETTQGETEQSGEAQIVTGVDGVLVFETSPGVFTAGVNPQGLVVSIDSVSMRTISGGLVPFYETTHYTVTDNFIEFNEAGIARAGGPLQITEEEFLIEYTYSLNTTNPNNDPGTALIQAMNGVHVIYECYTNREWGRGLPASVFDDANWREAADKLFNERFGLCIRWTRTDSIQSFVQVVLDHIGAVIYPDRSTGKIKIKLIRDDYSRDTLPLFDNENGLLEISEAAVSSQSQMINEVRVTYRDPVSNEDRTVRASNIASVQAAGGVTNSSTKNYRGLPTAELASRVAKRELRSMSPSIRRFNLTLDRRGYDVVPGGLIRVQDLSRNIPDMVLRIGTVDYGSLRNGRIQIVAMQDVFGLPTRGYTTIGPPQWTPANTRPCVGFSEAFELPYRSVYRAFSPADFSFIEDTDAYLGTVVAQGNVLNLSYVQAVRNGAVEPEDESPDDSYSCGLPPRAVTTATLAAGYSVGGRIGTTLSAGYAIAGTASASLSAGYAIESSGAVNDVIVDGFPTGLTNAGSLGGTFVPVMADESGTGSATVSGTTLVALANYNIGESDPTANQVGIYFDPGTVPTDPADADWTFEIEMRLIVTADDPFSSSGANAIYREAIACSLEFTPYAGALAGLRLAKSSGSLTASLISDEAGTLLSGIALDTNVAVKVSNKTGIAGANPIERRFYVNGTLIHTSYPATGTTRPEGAFVIVSQYTNGGAFYPSAGVEIRDANIEGRVAMLRLTLGATYGF